MIERYCSMGKEVLRDGLHFADTNSNEDAAAVADAMNAHEVDDPIMPELYETRDLDSFADDNGMMQNVVTTSHAVRREGDEYVCKCGVRWGTDEGDEHP